MSFRPDWAVPPGATIQEWLDENHMTQAELATRIDMSAKALNQMIRGHAPITHETALRLETVTGVRAAVWNSLEATWQEEAQRLRRQALLADWVEWVKKFPLDWLRNNGAITADGHQRPRQVEQVLSFFGVASPEAWEELWAKPVAAFRQSSAFEVHSSAVASWLRLAEIRAAQIPCASFDADKLRSSLPELRSLSLLRPEEYGPQLVQKCAEVGVALVFLPEPAGARCSGAARWLRNRYIVQLSLRHKSDDHLWFSFFHELGHVLLHDRTQIFIEGLGADHQAEKEAEANDFAGELLIPSEHEARLPQLRSLEAMRAFAHEIGVAPGVVVGRLQRDRGNYTIGNSLKTRLTFV